jgi:pimeloyl-ACP methyl ester carboxylesterase
MRMPVEDRSSAARRPSASRFLDVRGLRYHLRCWGPPADEADITVVMLHGWMDVSASFQFIADALVDPSWCLIAPDWRGYGMTERARADCYWFPDYLADLDRILDQVKSPRIVLAGHSMGGNVALLYAGIRPTRVAAVVNLEGFGLRATHATQAPQRYAQWLDELREGASMRDYSSLAEVEQRLLRNNARLTPERARFLAPNWSERQANGRWAIAGDPAHKIVNPTLYRVDEVLACWERITCPVLWVQADATEVLRFVGETPSAALREIEQRRAAIPDVESVVITDAGHMVHHDQPERVAAAIADFIARRLPGG